MANVKKYPPINKAAYNLLEIETVELVKGVIKVEWAFKEDEENTSSNVQLDIYTDWLTANGLLHESFDTTTADGSPASIERNIDFDTYWMFYDYSTKCEHMRRFLATSANNNISFTQLQSLSKTA